MKGCYRGGRGFPFLLIGVVSLSSSHDFLEQETQRERGRFQESDDRWNQPVNLFCEAATDHVER